MAVCSGFQLTAIFFFPKNGNEKFICDLCFFILLSSLEERRYQIEKNKKLTPIIASPSSEGEVAVRRTDGEGVKQKNSKGETS